MFPVLDDFAFFDFNAGQESVFPDVVTTDDAVKLVTEACSTGGADELVESLVVFVSANTRADWTALQIEKERLLAMRNPDPFGMHAYAITTLVVVCDARCEEVATPPCLCSR